MALVAPQVLSITFPAVVRPSANVFECLPQYAGSFCVGFALFLLLACGLITRGSRYQDNAFAIDSAEHSAVDTADDDDGIVSNSADSRWMHIIRLLLGIGSPTQEFPDGLSKSQIQVHSHL